MTTDTLIIMTLPSIRICWFIGDNYACGTAAIMLVSFSWKKKRKIRARVKRFRLTGGMLLQRLTKWPTKESLEWHRILSSLFLRAHRTWELTTNPSTLYGKPDFFFLRPGKERVVFKLILCFIWSFFTFIVLYFVK